MFECSEASERCEALKFELLSKCRLFVLIFFLFVFRRLQSSQPPSLSSNGVVSPPSNPPSNSSASSSYPITSPMVNIRLTFSTFPSFFRLTF